MSAAEEPFEKLVVVDAKPGDYESLVAALARHSVRVHLFATGEDALRAAETRRGELWLVNVHLPDMSGIGLLKLIRRRLQRSIVFLVGDVYSADDELAARTAGATAYVCKPPSVTWLETYQPRCREPTVRGPRKTSGAQ
jgi:two-component system KDP operon response regulator KdpE